MVLKNTVGSALALTLSLTSSAVLAEQSNPMVLVDRQGWFVRAHLQAGVNIVAEKDLYWCTESVIT
jgi:hypothetical protein